MKLLVERRIVSNEISPAALKPKPGDNGWEVTL